MTFITMKRVRQFFVILIISLLSFCFVQASTLRNTIDVVSFNVLAPPWADPSYYPTACAPYLDRAARRKSIINFLNSVAHKADIIALQETTPTEFIYFQQALQNNFYGFEVFHDKNYWSGWCTPETPWELNGVAIFVKKSTFTNVKFVDLPLTKDGNHSAYFEGIQQRTGLRVRVASIHLDSETARNRKLELKALVKFMPPEIGTRDIIAGDFNYGTQTGNIKKILVDNQFVDALKFLNREEWTHPFYEDGDRNAGILDHIVVRNLTPMDGYVLNFNLWELYPQDQTGRIIANLQLSGSDHFPISALLK